jgi:hypothetical protein
VVVEKGENIMHLGVQFRSSVPANATRRWFTHSWPEQYRVVWLVVPTGPVQDSSAQVEWNVEVTRQASNKLKYFIEVKNLSSQAINFETRYAILNT